MQTVNVIFPPKLSPKAVIGLVAPSSPISQEEKKKCVAYLTQRGFQVVLSDTLQNNENLYGYLAGSTRRRASDLNKMFSNPEINAIFCVRGGYGSSEILPYLDYEMIQKNPKIFLGYSDITAIHMALQKYCGFVTFHGPMVHTEFCKDWKKKKQWVEQEKESWQQEKDDLHTYMWNSLFQACNKKYSYEFFNLFPEDFQPLFQGTAQGILTGGNLSVLVRLLGTPYLADFQDKILFLEDVGEPLSKIHMNFIQLEQAGVFEKINGILLGDFTDCHNKKYDDSVQVEEILKKYIQKYKIPTLGNVCSDHRGVVGTLPIGSVCKIHVDEKSRVIF